MLKLRRSEGWMPRSAHCVARLIKNNINSRTPHSAPLRSRTRRSTATLTRCSAQLPCLLVLARGWLRVSATRLSALPDTRPPASRGGKLSACQVQREAAASLPRCVTAASLPCRAATDESLPTSTVGPLLRRTSHADEPPFSK
jgi:hypothetical protein